MNIIENMRHVAGKIGEKISGILEKTSLASPARKSGFIQRSTSKMQGEDFVHLMTTEILGDETVTAEGLCDILRQINPEAERTFRRNERYYVREPLQTEKKRKTTRQLPDESIPYMDSFLPDESENGDNSLIPFKKAA